MRVAEEHHDIEMKRRDQKAVTIVAESELIARVQAKMKTLFDKIAAVQNSTLTSACIGDIICANACTIDVSISPMSLPSQFWRLLPERGYAYYNG